MAGGKVYVYRKPPRRRPRRFAFRPGVALHAIFYDVGVAAEASGVERLDVQVSVETLPKPGIEYDVGVASERLSSSAPSVTAPAEWGGLTNVYYDATVPSEARSTSLSDKPTSLEWGGSVTAIHYDTGIAAENLAGGRLDFSAGLEINSSLKPIYYDVGTQFQLLATAQQDAFTPLEWQAFPVVIPPIFAPSGFDRLPDFTNADFQLGMQNLLPTGPVWPRDADAQQTQIIGALTQTYVRNAARANNLLSDAFPVQPVELLPEWELSLGLPDPCAGVLPTIQQRQQQVAARFIAGGGQSIAYYINFAATLGYTISITQFTTSRFGQPFGLPFNGAAWAFAWQVDAPTFAVESFEFGRDAFGEPFASWGNTVLQCEIQRLAPAHTTVTFSYS